MSRNPRAGILLMILTCAVFAAQDGLSRHLAERYGVFMVVMIRFWFLAAVVILWTRARTGSLRAVRSASPLLQILRGLLLAGEICVMVWAFTLLGLAESHAVFAVSPLLVAALSGPILGERVGWRRWTAIGIGFAGVLVILAPSDGVIDPRAAVPLLSAAMWALYGLLTRLAARHDPAATSFFWTGIVGALAMTPAGLWTWTPMEGTDWAVMGLLCVTAAAAHWLLIKAYELAEASVLQPFAFLQLVFASALGVLLFDETVELHVAIGAAVVVGAGLFTLWRERRARLAATRETVS
ncbi:Permease of the drug/metabolite transporter (DMT) superfamily [Rubellimicrobium thermophilum DSM 16684]|uniref:Permease of the drug/metabolite transporter (DMT) superfamily n=1 Tax=Rubellimicrobium thermophilum DSM 16684 TaxID=1123069 RepID=S9QTL7_9RHOB|nr:DMT family transporter [Rubellimicrobium thermophilum]EPX84696.1 Permease of the drug/metabolite transporter (DMT) superfamily [Rubellimicrobium thermophilum DSM 16684]